MRWAAAIVGLLVLGCASTPSPVTRTLPEVSFESQVPDEVARPDSGVSTLPVESCQDIDGNPTPGGVLFSDETAAYVARLRIGYDEMRQLYIIDSRTRDRERQIYETALANADDEIQRQAQRAERTWLEQYGGVVGLVAGIVVGVAATIGVLAATEEVRSGP